ncbi:MAG: alpha-E domain-containing protein [Burkholderiaceae bacterium]
MLSRVAWHLYWMARYMERAENMARILDVGASLAMLSQPGDESAAMEPLVITDSLEVFRERGVPVSAESVARFLAWDRDHPSSILNCLQACRENARAVRGAITSEMWECINDTWLQLNSRRSAQPTDSAFFDWVRERSHLMHGVMQATIRQGQPRHFIVLGMFLERADNTARILSVKQSPMGEADGSGAATAVPAKVRQGSDPARASVQARPGPVEDGLSEHYRLSAVLRSVSALEAYRDLRSDQIDDRGVAQLLIFDPTLPRSLRRCVEEVSHILAELPGNHARVARRLSAHMVALLQHGALEDVERVGLHVFLDRFIRNTVRLGEAVQEAYMPTA